MKISVVIRTLNEAKYLGELLQAISDQKLEEHETEVVLVDSGSTDSTLQIAESFGCRITHISPEDFSFGHSLNIGCEYALGDILVFISGHCIPVNENWLAELVAPIVEGRCAYTYGHQCGRDTTKYSERQVFEKYYPAQSLLPQTGFFANNANAAIGRDIWAKYRFDATLTGLEDMELAKRLVQDGGRVGYVSSASVYHIHDEQWAQVRNRYEREAIALRSIIPEARMTLPDFIGCTLIGIGRDSLAAIREGALIREFVSIFLFRFNQYLGSFRGTRLASKLSRMHTRAYFYPHDKFERIKHVNYEGYRSLTDESPQQPGAGQELQKDPRQTAIPMDSG